MPVKFRVNISLISLFILMKTYIMVIIIGLLFIIKMDLSVVDPETIKNLIKLLLNLCSIEIIAIIIDTISPLIYNLYVKTRLVNGK